jgi:N-formylglutamate amidohydrolase
MALLQIETVSDAAPPPFTRHGPATPEFPVVVSVPHAGRHYASSLLADAAVSASRLQLLEDRHADLLTSDIAKQGATIFVANHARAFIDLNRDPREIDPDLIDGAPPPGLLRSSRVRNGLGLIPSSLGGGPSLWRRRWSPDEIAVRIERFHAPYHDAIASALSAARLRFGTAILLECHSMPPLRPGLRGHPAPDIVIGDRFGQSAHGAHADLIEEVARSSGYRPARNAPYAGGYSLDRHGAPSRNIHALQIEIDRSRYLDDRLETPSPGLSAIQALVGAIFTALCDDLRASRHPMAAE